MPDIMIDMHVHFFPENVFRAIWNFFETRDSRLWSVKEKVYGDALVEKLRLLGVKHFTSLVYAHRPGMAGYLNDFVKESMGKYPEMLPFGTVYAGDGHCEKTARKIFEEYNFFGMKLHPFVSQEMIDDARLFPVYEIMEGMDKILLCHPGSAPVFSQKDGHVRIRNILTPFPKLKVIIAHCGAFETEEYSRIADEYEHVYFDTAMVCIPRETFHMTDAGKKFFLKHQDRIVFGSDFPNIPYAYEEQIRGLREMRLGEDVEKKIFSENARCLLFSF